MNKLKSRFYIIVFVFAIIFGISSCSNKKYPEPSDYFYINDYARVLTSEVKNYILYFSEQLYEDTKDQGYGGTQVVVATFIFDTAEEINDYRREEIYNQWEIGQNNMGLLIILYYSQEQFDGYTMPKYEKFEVAIGTGLTQYFTEIDAGIDMHDTIFPLYDDEEIALIHFYFEAIKRIYRDAYPNQFELFNYQEYLDDVITLFDEELYTFDRVGATPRSFLDTLLNFSFIFSGNTTYLIIGILALLLGGGVFKTMGGGGRSGGAGIFRRRR